MVCIYQIPKFSKSIMNLLKKIGSEFGIFGWFRWVHSSFLVDEPGFGRVQSSVFPDLGLCSVEPISQPNKFKVQAFWRSSNRVEVRF